MISDEVGLFSFTEIMLIDRLKNLRNRLAKAYSSSKGHDLLQYLLFACVAFVFWFFLSLDNLVQRDFNVPLTLTNVPDSVVLIDEMPPSLNVVVEGKGSQLLPFSWGGMHGLRLKFSDASTEGGKLFHLSKERLEARLRDYFGQSVQLLAVKPDSISVRYTSSHGVKLPLKVYSEVRPDIGYVIYGEITTDVDSVTVYSTHGHEKTLSYIETEPIVLTNLKDSTSLSVNVQKLDGCRIIPDKVTVDIPVEPLISKHRQVKIDVINLPLDVGFITFPSMIDVTYLVPMSCFNVDHRISVYVDYNSLKPGDNKIKVNLSRPSDLYRNVTLSKDSVEFVLERK